MGVHRTHSEGRRTTRRHVARHAAGRHRRRNGRRTGRRVRVVRRLRCRPRDGRRARARVARAAGTSHGRRGGIAVRRRGSRVTERRLARKGRRNGRAGGRSWSRCGGDGQLCVGWRRSHCSARCSAAGGVAVMSAVVSARCSAGGGFAIVSAVVSAGCKLGRSNSSTQHRQRGRRRRGWRDRALGTCRRGSGWITWHPPRAGAAPHLLVRLGSDVRCHVICRNVRSEHAVIDAGVVCARGGGRSSCGRWHRGRWHNGRWHRGRAGQRRAAGSRGWQRRRLC